MIEVPMAIEHAESTNVWQTLTSLPQSSCITVAIPAFNEERFIGSVVLQAFEYTPNVVVIDDGSHDNTSTIARRAGATVLRHIENKGKSAAMNTALTWARRNDVPVLVFIDGDGQHRPDEIMQVAQPVLAGEADIVIGSRFLGIKSEIPAYRKVGQHALTFTTNFTSGVSVTDSQSGFRALSRKAIEELHFSGTGLSVESEMQFLARENKLNVREVPISVIYHEKAKRNPISHGMQILTNITKLVGQGRPLLFFGVPGAIAVLLGLIIGILVVNIYTDTRTLAVGYALISILLTIIGILAVMVGLILHSMRAFFLDIKTVVLHQSVFDATTEIR